MENSKYSELKEHLQDVLKTAKKLGLDVQPAGGYSMGYDINNLPPYPVNLFGALSIVEGSGARCKLGLTFDETQSLEAGFNGCSPDIKNKKKKRKRTFKINAELMKLGAELRFMFHRRPRGYSMGTRSTWETYRDMPVAPVSVKQTKKQISSFVPFNFSNSESSELVVLPPDSIAWENAIPRVEKSKSSLPVDSNFIQQMIDNYSNHKVVKEILSKKVAAKLGEIEPNSADEFDDDEDEEMLDHGN